MALPIQDAQDVEGEALGPFTRKVLFAPSLGNSQYQRMAMVIAQPGARSPVHTHRGNKAVYTFQGEILIQVAGREYRVGPGRAIMIPPDMPHPGLVTRDAPWVSVCFYCDECPALAAYRAGGGTVREEQPRVGSADESEAEQVGELRRRILFTPSRDGVNFLRLGVAEGPVGARGSVHTHPGNECFFTMSGQATLIIGGEPHVVNPYYGMAIPPDTEHPLTSTGTEVWAAVAAYCDDCHVLRGARGRVP